MSRNYPRSGRAATSPGFKGSIRNVNITIPIPTPKIYAVSLDPSQMINSYQATALRIHFSEAMAHPLLVDTFGLNNPTIGGPSVLPTGMDIIDPLTWRINFGVTVTAGQEWFKAGGDTDWSSENGVPLEGTSGNTLYPDGTQFVQPIITGVTTTAGSTVWNIATNVELDSTIDPAGWLTNGHAASMVVKISPLQYQATAPYPLYYPDAWTYNEGPSPWHTTRGVPLSNTNGSITDSSVQSSYTPGITGITIDQSTNDGSGNFTAIIASFDQPMTTGFNPSEWSFNSNPGNGGAWLDNRTLRVTWGTSFTAGQYIQFSPETPPYITGTNGQSPNPYAGYAN